MRSARSKPNGTGTHPRSTGTCRCDTRRHRQPNRRYAMKRVLIANRGEIALRIIRACHEEGLEAVAVYSAADRASPHVRAADQAVAIGPAAPAQSYLNIERLIEAARESGADAVH